jgi:hypothetical protein
MFVSILFYFLINIITPIPVSFTPINFPLTTYERRAFQIELVLWDDEGKLLDCEEFQNVSKKNINEIFQISFSNTQEELKTHSWEDSSISCGMTSAKFRLFYNLF